MILAQLKDYLKKREQCSLSELALHFDTQADALRGMLDLWIKKGKVSKQMATDSCGSQCQSCDPASTEIYRWKQNQQQTVTISYPSSCEHNNIS